MDEPRCVPFWMSSNASVTCSGNVMAVVELIRRLLSGMIRRLLPAVDTPCESMASYTENVRVHMM